MRYIPNVEYSKLSPDYTGIRAKLSGPGEPFRVCLMLVMKCVYGLKFRILLSAKNRVLDLEELLTYWESNLLVLRHRCR
jgi:hypothetical protein